MTVFTGDCISFFCTKNEKKRHCEAIFTIFLQLQYFSVFLFNIISFTVRFWLHLRCIWVRMCSVSVKSCAFCGQLQGWHRRVAAFLFMSAVFCCAAACVTALTLIIRVSIAASGLCYSASLRALLLSCHLTILSQTSCDCPYCFHTVQFSRKQYLRWLTIGFPISPCTQVIDL